MSRPLRIEYPGAIYHIFQRGIERKNIFLTKSDRKKFLSYLAYAARKHNCLIHSYCMMSNHFHLILQTLQANLSKFMHYLNSSYVTYFNIKLERVGPLYQGRYKSIFVQEGEYLQHLSRYIHLNPVRAKIVKNPIDYPYSSYRYFVNNANPPQWLQINQILCGFSPDWKTAKHLYQEFVINNPKDSVEYLKNNTYHRLVLGDKEYFERIKRDYLKDRIDNEIPLLNKLKPKIETELISNIIDSRITDKRLNRKIKIYFLYKLTDNSLKEIGHISGGINYKTVSKICARCKASSISNYNLTILLENIEKAIMSNVET